MIKATRDKSAPFVFASEARQSIQSCSEWIAASRGSSQRRRTFFAKRFRTITAFIMSLLVATAAHAQLSVDVDGSIEKDLNIAVPALATPQDAPTLAGSTVALGVSTVCEGPGSQAMGFGRVDL